MQLERRRRDMVQVAVVANNACKAKKHNKNARSEFELAKRAAESITGASCTTGAEHSSSEYYFYSNYDE